MLLKRQSRLAEPEVPLANIVSALTAASRLLQSESLARLLNLFSAIIFLLPATACSAAAHARFRSSTPAYHHAHTLAAYAHTFVPVFGTHS